jgi:hypothetical protein
MDRDDRQAIDLLFEKLAAVEENSPQRDAASEAFISERIAHQPSAPYYMAQTIVVQNQALAAAEARIAELEGRNGSGQRRAGSVPVVGRDAPAASRTGESRTGLWRGAQADAQAGGGGFLAGAAQTALGVAGGFLLGNAIAGMFGGGSQAQAAEANPQSDQPPAEEPQTDSAGYDDGGFDGGGFDGGFGDF